MMTPEHWQKVKEIFHSALQQEPARRQGFLAEACGDDVELRREVESLISAHEKDGSFIDSPAYEVAATVLTTGDELSTGQIFGRYQILSTLGRGGMGEVYLAEDSRLGRKVALKFLSQSFMNDPDRLRRFEQEARAASSLNHPNILTIHEIGNVEGGHFIATEVVEGETLRQRILSGRMKVPEVLDIAVQVGGALRAAHAAGIVHRDIKPENVMVRPDGIVKVLDFGLAKLTEQTPTSESEAMTRLKTNPGMVMGTAQYMSPEQARGLEVDARADIWSFGCVIYEMLMGRAPFRGATASHVIVSILEKEPAWHEWPLGEMAAEMEWIVRKSLRKEPEERYQTAKELLGDLKSLKQRSEFSAELDRTTPLAEGTPIATVVTNATGSSRITEAQPTPIASGRDTLGKAFGRQRRFVALALAILAFATVVGIYVFAVRNQPADKEKTSSLADTPGVLKASQITSGSGLDLHPSLSPDGNSIAYSSDHGSGYEIYVRQLTPGGREIQLTSDGAQNFEPAWAPDGKLIAYHSKKRGGVWIVPALGGVAKQLTEFGSNPAWSPDGGSLVLQSSGIGDDLFAIGSGALLTTTLWTISSQGGTPRQITVMGKPAGGHGSPSWSPDGKRIAFTSYDPAKSDIFTITVEGDQLKRVADGTDPIYAPDGENIYFVSYGTANLNFGLSKVRVSRESGEPVGEPIEIASTGPARLKRLAISADGKRIAYTPLTVVSNLLSVRVPLRANEATGPPVALTHDTSYRNSSPAFSPDGKKVAYNVTRVGGGGDIWLLDSDGENAIQLTTDPDPDMRPSWFPDGEQIAFQSYRQGKNMMLAIDRKSGKERTLFEPAQDLTFPRISPDGKQLAFNSKKSGTTNIWVASIESGAVKQLTFDKEAIGFPCWSPDGRFLAFEVKRGDTTHIGIMPSAGGQVVELTSDRGQGWPHSWSPDGDKITFAGFRNGLWNLWWVSRTSRALKQVTNYTKLNAFVRYPAWSPQGDRIVYEYTETTGNIWLMELK
ncbi:MAG TPA: protein kinase [Pyrinomonadaceae bacterium]|nr:protein kinase [Pyrinomonadaceae bacterium]